MKRILLLLLCTTTLGLVSCKKETIIQETENRTIIVTIQPSQWKLTADNRTYNAEISIPEIDQINVDIEGILVYRDHPVNAGSYIQLPFTFESQAYSYEQFNGGLSFDIQDTDFLDNVTPQKPTLPMQFKVVLIPSRDIT